MSHKFKYGTASEAVTKLRVLGFDKDFAIKDDCLYCDTDKFGPEDVRITYTSRYEGNSDPSDESTVYGLETKSGLRGILVTADGIYSDRNTAAILQKLHLAKLESYRDHIDENDR